MCRTRTNSRNGHMGVLERTRSSNKTCHNYDDGGYRYRQDIGPSLLSLPVSSSFLGRCPYPVAHPLASHECYSLQTVLAASWHTEPKLQGTACPVLWIWCCWICSSREKMTVKCFPAAREKHDCICIMGIGVYVSMRNLSGECSGWAAAIEINWRPCLDSSSIV